MAAAEDEPVFAVYYPENIICSPRTLYSSVKDAAKFANSPEAKPQGARFKRFGTPREALSFLDGTCLSPVVSSTDASGSVPAEPPIPFKSVSRIEMSQLKKVVEKCQTEEFTKLLEGNPRYIVNTSGDTPAIVQEGFRFNVLHIAAKAGATEIVELVLSSVWNVDFLVKLYGTTPEDVLFRRTNILLGFLHTPDKGSCDTPLHIACKFGRIEVVRALLKQPLCDRTLRNKLDRTPFDEICSRFNGEKVDQLKRDMRLLFTGVYVPLYRTPDNCAPAKILPPTEYPRINWSPPSPYLNASTPSSSLHAFSYSLAAFAGPFEKYETANAFYKEWLHSGKTVKRTDMDKGYERIGRDLSKRIDVEWNESWFFLQSFCDITLDDGLKRLESHLLKLRIDGVVRSAEEIEELNEIRQRLTFDDEDDDDEILPNSSKVFTPNRVSIEDDDEYLDANDSFVEEPLNDSLMGIVESLGGLTIHSPKYCPDPNLEEEISEADTEPSSIDTGYCMESDDEYDTPPPSPPPIYLLDIPTKADNDLFLALSSVPLEKIEKYPQVAYFARKMGNLSAASRQEWPAKDSPRCRRIRSERSTVDGYCR